MLVDSIATVVMPSSTSQSARRFRSPVKLRKDRTGSGSRSIGTATTWNVALMSTPAARRWIGANAAGADIPFVLLLAMITSKAGRKGGARIENTFLNGIAEASPVPSPQRSLDQVFLRGRSLQEVYGRSFRARRRS